MDVERFEELAGWFEFDDGRSRFEAETLAAARIGFKRHEVKNEISKRNSQGGGNIRPAPAGQPADHMSRVQPKQAEENGPLPVGDIQAGRDRLALLALPA